MQTLRLQTPPITGEDVAAWQRFLTAQGAANLAIDGVFGPASDAATREYQASHGLEADGVVGMGTWAQAVRDGFAGSGTAGMDACVDCAPFASGIVAAGMKFVGRYYSRFAGKALTRTEALALSRAGLQLATVYQDVNDDIRYFSAEQGRQQAARALAEAAAVGQPAGSAIYFATDFDPTPDQIAGPMTDYFQAVAQALSAAATRYAVGICGSGLACRTLRDAGLARFTWLSGSMGYRESASFRGEANLVQIAPSRTILEGRLAIDDDVAPGGEFGGFQVH